jgi:hypothetical protein
MDSGMTDQTDNSSNNSASNSTKNSTAKPYADRNVWLRGLMMLVFMFCLGVAKFVLFVVVAFQFLNVLFTASTNSNLLRFGQDLSSYQYQIMRFLTYNTEQQPFPVGAWPSGKVDSR